MSCSRGSSGTDTTTFFAVPSPSFFSVNVYPRESPGLVGAPFVSTTVSVVLEKSMLDDAVRTVASACAAVVGSSDFCGDARPS